LFPAAVLHLEKALDFARIAVAKEHPFQALVNEGKQAEVKKIVTSLLRQDGLATPSVKEVLVVIFFQQIDGWGRNLGHLFENKFSLEVFALAVSLVR
jgi:hypothetical protein